MSNAFAPYVICVWRPWAQETHSSIWPPDLQPGPRPSAAGTCTLLPSPHRFPAPKTSGGRSPRPSTVLTGPTSPPALERHVSGRGPLVGAGPLSPNRLTSMPQPKTRTPPWGQQASAFDDVGQCRHFWPLSDIVIHFGCLWPFLAAFLPLFPPLAPFGHFWPILTIRLFFTIFIHFWPFSSHFALLVFFISFFAHFWSLWPIQFDHRDHFDR